MKPKRKLVVAALALVLLITLWFFLRGDGPPGHTLRVSGNIELTEVRVAFKMPGKLAECPLEEGDRVQRGAVVARLDSEQLLLQRDRERAGLEAAEAHLAQLLTALEFQKETTEGQIAQRTAEVSQAEAQLRELITGSRKQEVARARALADEARSGYERAVADWERARKLFEAQDIPRSRRDEAFAGRDAAAARLKQAEETLALVEEGPRAETIQLARAGLDKARAGLRQAEALRLEVKRRQQEIDARRADVERARSQLALVESQLQDATAVTPIDGVVLAKLAEPGEVLAAGTAVVTLGDMERPWLRAYITEEDLGRVALGASATVTTDSYPGKTYTGRVGYIASEAEFTPKQIQTSRERVKLVYRVKVFVENPQGELKLNMPADVEIALKN